MKPNLIICFAFASLIACGSNKAPEETKVPSTEQKTEVASNPVTDQPISDDITGQWKLKLEAYDNNENKILDEDEKKKGIKNNYLFRFNADGSCQIQQMFKGHYEVKTQGDKKRLYVYRKKIEGEEDKDPPPDVYQIISLNKNELVLLETEGNLTFWVFEKLV
jgi:hypothetical protein